MKMKLGTRPLGMGMGMGMALLSLALVAGCGPSTAGQMKTNPVKGKVTLNGAPIAGAQITFFPLDKGVPAALGVSDAEGNYVLQTYAPNDGAVAGNYKVLVTKSAPSSGPAEVAHDPTGAGGLAGPPASHSGPKGGAGAGGGSALPEKYSKSDTSPLSTSVKEGENTYDIQMN